MRNILMNKYVKLTIETVAAALSLFLAFQIRFDGRVPAPDQITMVRLLLPLAVLRLATIFLFRLSNQKWRYTTARDASRIAVAQALPTAILLVLRLGAGRGPWYTMSLGVIAIDYLMILMMSFGIRVFWRMLCESRADAAPSGQPARKLLLVGAGDHGAMIASGLVRNKNVSIVGFLDDDSHKHGAVIGGVKVLGPTSMLEELVKEHNIDDVLICTPAAERDALQMKSLTNRAGARVTIVPTVDDVLQSDWTQVQPASRKPVLVKRATPKQPETRAAKGVSGKRILITGGAGFIGSSLAARLAADNELVLFDLTFANKPLSFTGVKGPNVKLVEGDILDEKLLAGICGDVDMVIHTAAVLGVSRVCNAARDTLETNYIGTSRLLRALESNKHLERFVYFSTSEVFGINSYRVTEDMPSNIGSSSEARWSYAIAKVAGEHLVRSYYRETGMPGVTVRPFNVFGPRRTGDYALLRFAMSALAGNPLVVHGDGSQIRAWCYIDDFCDAIIAMLERPGAVGEDFNIGNPANTVTVYDLARRVIELAGSPSTIALIENPFPDISIRVPSIAKAQELLGYQPRFDLDTALSNTIEWYRKYWNQLPEVVRTGMKLVPASEREDAAVARAAAGR